MEILFIHWNPDPVAFSLGVIHVRWYGLLFALPFAVGYYIMRNMFERENQPVQHLDTLLTYVVISTVIGARLGHCLFYEPKIYLAEPIRILKIWEGGLASHGAGIGVIMGLLLFSQKTRISFWWIADRLAILVGLAGLTIRTGNLFNSEIYGKPTDLPWAFIFERVDAVPRHPTQIYEALSYFAVFLWMFWIYRKRVREGKTMKPGWFLGLLLILIFTLRLLIEFLKEPQVEFEQNMLINMGQLLSLPFIAVGIFLMLRKHQTA